MFYNLYKDSVNIQVLKLAVTRTAIKRGSLDTMSEWKEIITDMRVDSLLTQLWNNYCQNNSYAAGINFETVMDTTQIIAELLDF